MQNIRYVKKSLLMTALSSTLFQPLYAAGFQLNAQSATGLGRAFAGDAVIADNASVMARNAAAMMLFKKTSLSLGLNLIKTDIQVKDATYNQQHIIAPGVGYRDSADYNNAGDTSYAPNIHLIVPIDERFAVGVNLYSNFGTKTEFNNTFVASEYGGHTELKTINLGLSGAYRLNSQWSFGAGLDVIYGEGKLKRNLNVYSPIDGSILQSKKVLDADIEGVGLGFNIGTVFELDENNRFGLSYRYSPRVHGKGDVSYNGAEQHNDTVYVPLPDMAEFSGYHHIPQTQFAVHYSVQWIGWSAFDTLDSKEFATINNYEWQDAMHFSLGATYYLNSKWTLRSGYMYDQSAQNKVTSVSVPDSDCQWFSAGVSYHIDENANVDFGATYLLGKDVKVNESTESDGVEISDLHATTHANAILLALQYSQQF
ncbi:outer membrane protein transport protein [Psychromonas sp. MME1]|uniref:outer membrane protein transport protein n=1 Tax=Psychromonas sp. MME1 TaxID=3231032 RepID=UPI0034E21C61